MKLNHALSIIERELSKSGYEYKRHNSKSSESVYYSLSNGKGITLLFRVSDHRTRTDVITFRVDHKSTEKLLIAFVKNRVKGLQQRSLDSLLY